jgi:error-prone DNA polymerase
MFTHLHTRSVFSFLQAGSTPEDLVRRARSLDFNALALTDVNGVYGAVRFLKACRQQEIKGLIGAEVMVDANPLVLIARNTDGYTDLCRILTRTHMMDRKFPFATLDTLASHSADLFCLTGGRDGLLRQFIAARRQPEAERWIETLKDIFQNRLFVELTHHLVYGDNHIIPALHHFARQNHVNVVATNDVRYAESKDYRRYDLLTCVRLGITVMDPHPARPVNAEASLKSETDLRKLIKYPEAFENSALITENCALDLVPELITPPDARIPDNTPPLAYLDTLCKDALIRKYPETRRDNAVKQYRREIDVIAGLGLEEYFLVVREVVHEAWRRGIRCAGRGSAANSIVAYLLDITGVDPLAHNLLFERFLHGGRKGTPDIDIDFDSERRDEIIEWMEHRFGIEQTAMTATVVTYQLRLALRDTAKTLGWPQDIINRLTPAIPSRRASAVREYRHNLVPILGESPLFELLLDLVESLENCPRHLGLHVGGMILSRKPLPHFSPVQISANGVKMVQFDKNDVEALGLVKLDVLGLRMLATLSEAVEIATRADDPPTDIDHIPLDDEKVYHMICHDSTIGLFQIESQGQIHLLAVNQPRTFDDLVAEIALFRPGPLQGGMVHPYIRRRKGQEKVTFDHPDLAPILADTYGIILFQEQVLEVAHRFAGMSLAEADDFRALMSKYRDPSEMESMRTRFVTGAIHRGVPEQTANLVFDRVSKFVGYGFCRSHAAAFAKIVYQSAWMKCYHPAPYMAAFMQHRPGMYSLMTLEQ